MIEFVHTKMEADTEMELIYEYPDAEETSNPQFDEFYEW